MRKSSGILIPLMVLLWSCDSIMDSGPGTNSTQQANSPSHAGSQEVSFASSEIWMGAYLAAWNHYVEPTGNWGNLPTDEIDWDAFTHLYYFALAAQSDGSLSPIEPYRNFGPDRVEEAVEYAHANGVPILYTVGGWGNYDGFSSAIEPENRSNFIDNLIEVMTTWDFDGIDLDMEPIRERDVGNYSALVRELSEELDQLETPMTDRPFLTAAVGNQPAMFADLQHYFDQINIMTYDFSNAWGGWVSWHNSNLFNGGQTFPSTGGELPSVERSVGRFMQAGVAREKIGIGLDFYGYIWHGEVDGPMQEWDTPPEVEDNVAYYEIMDKYFTEDRYNWDETAYAPYLSISSSNPSQRKFISYDDERLMREKVNYIYEKGLGGGIIWELGGGYRADQPAGERDVLLQAIKEAILNPGDIEIDDPQPADGAIYADGLAGNWTDASWDATVELQDNSQSYSGSSSIRVEQQSWGALSLLRGDWNNPQLIPVSGYNYVTFAVYPQGEDAVLDIILENMNGDSFPRVRAGEVPANEWTVVSVPVDELNPENLDVHRIGISESSGSSITYFIDGYHLSEKAKGDGPIYDRQYTVVYDDELISPWIDASWDATVNYQSNSVTYTGSSSIRVDQQAWGALSLLHGDWNSPEVIPLSDYEYVTFAIYPEEQDAVVDMILENMDGDNFPRVRVGEVPADQWTVISAPVEELNPEGREVHRIGISESSGSSATYYIDGYNLSE